jgi:imidazolonepropionase-like amidohydrolase
VNAFFDSKLGGRLPSWLLAVPAGLLLSAAPASEVASERPQDPPSGNFAVRCGTLIDGRGATTANCWLVVRNGKIADISNAAEAPRGLPIVDASDRVVMPGLVLADSELSGVVDDEYNVTPDFCALDGFDFARDYRSALAAGVTSAYLSPGRNRLISGQGSVVKLAGDDPVARAVAENACLRVNLGPGSTQAPPIFDPSVYPTADDPLVPAQPQYPSAAISQLSVLNQLFGEALESDDLRGGRSAERRFDQSALRRAARGELRLRIAARSAAEVERALALADRLGQKVVIEDPAEIGAIGALIAERKAQIVVRMPLRLSDNNAGGENRADRTPRSDPATLRAASRFGVPLALAPAVGESADDLLLLAGLAVRYGMSREAAIAAITSTAAAALGVGDRIGSLEVGRDADFVVLSGDPLAVGSMVEETWVDGVQRYTRDETGAVLAIRAARIVTASGPSLREGTVLISNGKIRAVGEDLAIPYGAKIIDLRAEGGVVVPGFLDSDSRLGLGAEVGGIPPGNPAQRVAKAVRHDDPSFRRAIEAGVTTVLVSGLDSAAVGGRVAAIKTGARDAKSMVIDEIAAQRFTFDATNPQAIAQLAGELDKGKRYLDTWLAYEKALADWKAGKSKPAPAPATSSEPAADKPVDPVSGTWTCSMEIPQMGLAIEIVLELKLEGTAVTGTATLNLRGRSLPAQPVTNGKFENGELSMELRLMGGQGTLTAKIENDKLTGKASAMGQDVDVTGTRTAKPGEAKPAATSAANATTNADGSPKKPKVEEALEPLKELIEGKATAVVRSNRAPAIEAVVKLFTERKVRFVIQGAEDAMDEVALLGKTPPTIVLGPQLVQREDGEVVNAPARFADAGVRVAFATGDCEGTRWLPEHAMHAVRWGLDPETALRAITIESARAFGIDGRVGSIERGKDADLCVFDGNPLEPTSRLLLVLCNGQICLDNHKDAR